MRLCNSLPIPFLEKSGRVQVLLTAVGVKLPATFDTLHSTVTHLCSTLELDIPLIAPEFFDIRGQVQFEVSVCESEDALPFLLGMADPLFPQLDFHVIVGAAVAESQQELVACAGDFDCVVRQAASPAVPCLFVFTSSSFDSSCLPACATPIPSASTESDVTRRMREGFMRCAMGFLMDARNRCDDLNSTRDRPESLMKLAGYATMLGGLDIAEELYAAACRAKPQPAVASGLVLERMYNDVKLEAIHGIEREVPTVLHDMKGMSMELTTTIALAEKSQDRLVMMRTLLRCANFAPEFAKVLLVLCLKYTSEDNEQSPHYTQLALMLLHHCGQERTFMFWTSVYLGDGFEFTSALLSVFTECLTSKDDWHEQRITLATQMFTNDKLHRAIKNRLMVYLLTHLHRLKNGKRQREMLSLIPAGLEIDAEVLIGVRGIEPERLTNPIAKACVQSNVFIYSPLSKRDTELRCSVGDEVSFAVTVYNPLAMSIHVDIVSLIAANGRVFPTNLHIGSRRSVTFPLMVVAEHVGELIISGFTFVAGRVTATYRLPTPIVCDVVEKLPIIVVSRPARMEAESIENSLVRLPFKLMNTSDVDVAVKGITFGPMPPVLTSVSLPIAYPPAVEPPLPEVLKAGSSHDFNFAFQIDKTNNTLSYAIEYGTSEFSRRFEMNHEFTVVDGPKIKSVQVVPLLDHDDFDNNTVTVVAVIENPMHSPVVVGMNGDQNTVVEANGLGTFIVEVDRINVAISDKWNDERIDKEHIRKCEVVATKEKNERLTIEEKRELWTTLLVKYELEKRLRLDWTIVDGSFGSLSFTHVPIDTATLTLVQSPRFSAKFSLEKFRENIWNLTCDVSSETPISMDVRLSFDLIDSEDPNNYVMIAGSEHNVVAAPCSFVTAIHCLPNATLSIIGKFFIGAAYYVKLANFRLN